ncbi:hypothetical protein IJ556_04245 [bacterium]|nr:hypothetical protein [bacterium]
MKNLNKKVLWKAVELSTFALGLLLIFACASDGCWNGRLLLGLVLLVASYRAEIKYKKEDK